MPIKYHLKDYAHFLKMHLRHQRRQKAWEHVFEKALASGDYQLPFASVLQIIPTEACNLRCPMCNQWGENGYFLEGLRPVDHMNYDDLAGLIGQFSPRQTFLSIHGGEPFAYKHIGRLLELLAERPFDVMFSTNGTLLKRHLEALTQIKNLSFLLSIDGDREAHDRIRGKGRFQQARESLQALFDMRRRAGMPLPLVIMSFVVCEWNGDVIEKMPDVAADFGAFALNYNMRWFLSEDIGKDYERHLQAHFGLSSSGAWRGWLTPHEFDYSSSAATLARLTERHRRRLRPPYIISTPGKLRGDDFAEYFADFENVFGNESCFMPFYWARVHANGDLIYCPGHPDIIAGNVFRDGFQAAFNSEITVRFRKHILQQRLPICNRCCGLYMTSAGRPAEQRVRKKLGLQNL